MRNPANVKEKFQASFIFQKISVSRYYVTLKLNVMNSWRCELIEIIIINKRVRLQLSTHLRLS